jgi:multimeric flavodoxin WrbA
MNEAQRRRVLAVSSSPRRRGNSSTLAQAVLEGAAEKGHAVEFLQVADHVKGMLRNCRDCRRPDGSCSIEDAYEDIFLSKFLPADGIVLATPIWWYGMSGLLKTFLDRMFCYIAASYPDRERVNSQLVGKKLILVLSAEESNLAARLGIVHQVQELCRYLHYQFVGVVTGIGNSTGEVRDDPNDPVAAARDLGRRFFSTVETDYKLDTPRSPSVWSDDDGHFPTSWR